MRDGNKMKEFQRLTYAERLNKIADANGARRIFNERDSRILRLKVSKVSHRS
jgi:hypothetical protein